MDLRVRYWDSRTTTVATRYYNLKLLGKAPFKDVLEKFKQCEIDQDKLLQLSMDGPNVNTSILSMLSKEQGEEELSDLMSIEACGLSNMVRIQLNGN